MSKKNQGTKKAKSKDQPYKPADNSLLITIVETSIPRSEVSNVATTNIESHTLLDYAGMLIANKKRPTEKGTMGGVLSSDKGDVYGLTCFHVVKQNNTDLTQFLPEESVEVILEDGNSIGVFTQETAIFNTKLDVALIKLSGKFHNKRIDSPTKYIDITEADLGTEVYFFNDRNKKKVKGFIRRINQKGNWELGKYENVTFVSSSMDDDSCRRISDKGDSGSWMMRVSDNALIGVIFANSATSTWVMPFSEIIQAYKKKNITLTLNLLP